MKKTTLTASVVFIATASLFACDDPNDPSCQTTNAPSTNIVTTVYTNGEAFLSISGLVITDHGFSSNSAWMLEQSSDATTWTDLMPFIGTTLNTNVGNNGSAMVHRARLLPGPVVWTNPFQQITSGNSNACPGSFVAVANFTGSYYSGTNYNWGYEIETNAPVHSATDLTRSDTRVQYADLYGGNDCNIRSVSIKTNDLSHQMVRFSIYFRTAVSTNAYPLWLQGVTE